MREFATTKLSHVEQEDPTAPNGRGPDRQTPFAFDQTIHVEGQSLLCKRCGERIEAPFLDCLPCMGVDPTKHKLSRSKRRSSKPSNAVSEREHARWQQCLVDWNTAVAQSKLAFEDRSDSIKFHEERP